MAGWTEYMVHWRIGFSPMSDESRHFLTSLLEGHPISQPSKHVVVVPAAIFARRVELQRCPGFGGVGLTRWKDKTFGHDANHLAFDASEKHVLVWYVRIAGVRSLPETVGK